MTRENLPEVHFASAKPVWPEGREREMNLLVIFRAEFEAAGNRPVVIRTAGSSVYRISVNGTFLGHGPARGPHGYYRVDEWDATPWIAPVANRVQIEVAGCNVNSYYVLDQPSFLQAEVVSEGMILASTAGEGAPFEASISKELVQKVPRYSFQRTFVEVHRLTAEPSLAPAACSVVSEKQLIPRRISYPTFSKRQPTRHVANGTLQTGIKPKPLWRSRFMTMVGDEFAGYGEEECEVIPSFELQKVVTETRADLNEHYSPHEAIRLFGAAYRALDFGTNLTGFIGAEVTCREDARLFITFDEVLTDGDVDFKRMNCINILSYEIAPGTYDIESFHPYTLRYLKLIVLDGECEIQNIYLREYANPDVWEAHFAAGDPALNHIFEAGRETFRQNAVDIFMDCPSRERAGWLCDSFFTARVALDLCGGTSVEKNFYENFLLPDRFPHLPEGMLPMCYPADHRNGNFIPNWAMWFVIELEEYLARSGDRALVDALKPRVMKLFDYFARFKNSDGLLEKLERWVFLEWSKANEFVQDVNYPTNMVYAGALSAASRTYGMPELLDEAERIRETIRRQSFDGEFFVDNAVRKNGKLEVTTNRTEVCQYCAFFFDVAAPETHPDLWKALLEEFGPRRRETNAFPGVYPANAFIGNYLRLELLSRCGHCRQLLAECRDFFLYMADRTGTLWENIDSRASCNHGFASHVVHALYRDVLGVHSIDPQKRTIRLRFSDLPLDWCEGRIPIANGAVSLRWWKDGDAMCYSLSVPAGYEVEVENLTGTHLRRAEA